MFRNCMFCSLQSHLSNKVDLNPNNMSTPPIAVTPAATPETPEDIEDKNLSWLFNFKLEDLPHLSPEAKRKQVPKNAGPTGAGGPVGSTVHAAISQLEPEPGLDQSTAIEEDDMNVAENVTIENSTAAAAAKV